MATTATRQKAGRAGEVRLARVEVVPDEPVVSETPVVVRIVIDQRRRGEGRAEA